MGFFKYLGYGLGGAALGVAAVAAAPFTGGGSLLGAATLATSLAGAGTIASAAGIAAVAGGTGAYLAKRSEDEDEETERQLSEFRLKVEKYEEGFKIALERFQSDKEYFDYIIAITALGLSIANVDGEISEEEIQEIEEFIGGIASSNYPEHVKSTIAKIYNNIPNFNTAMTYLEKINPSNYANIRDLLELVVMVDGIRHEKEEAYLKAYDSQITMIEYKPENNSNENTFLLEAQSRY